MWVGALVSRVVVTSNVDRFPSELRSMYRERGRQMFFLAPYPARGSHLDGPFSP